MNDNRLYIMKDFTYMILCKHLHKHRLINASRTDIWAGVSSRRILFSRIKGFGKMACNLGKTIR